MRGLHRESFHAIVQAPELSDLNKFAAWLGMMRISPLTARWLGNSSPQTHPAMKLRALFTFGVLLPALASAATLNRATITEVVKEVNVISGATKAQKAARVREIFNTPDVLRTGAESRAELVADDQTITRVGANTLFSFEPGQREIQLQRGSVLFHSPAGKGGGTIKTAAATAAVLGTTLIVVTTRNGGFKVLVLEGRGRVRAPGGSRSLGAGQMTYLLPGGRLGPVYDFQLSEQVAASRLVSGFRTKLASQPKIDAAIAQQNAKIAKGKLGQTGLLAGDTPGEAYAVVTRDVLQETLQTREEEEEIVVPDPGARFADATTTDALVSVPELAPERVFTLGSDDLPGVDSTLRVTGQPGQPGQLALADSSTGTLFVARNTQLATPAIDLRDFAGSDLIQFLSLEDLRIGRSVVIGGGGDAPVSLLAGGTITNAPGAILTVRTPRLEVLSLGTFIDPSSGIERSIGQAATLALANFGLGNPVGDIAMIGPSMRLNRVGIAASGDLAIRSEGALQIRDSLTANPRFRLQGNVGVPPAFTLPPSTTPNRRGLEAGRDLAVTARRDITFERVDLSANRILIDAGGALRIQGSRLSNAAFNAGTGQVVLRGGPLVDVTNARFQVQSVSMAAQTINLRNVSFAGGSTVVLRSALGQLAPAPNQNAPSRPGFVNFINNVTYDNVPAQQAVGAGITIRR
jgi:hypothetical protein